MTDKPVFQEIESPVQFNELSPGMYAANCPGRFDTEVTQTLVQCAAATKDSGFYSGSFLGMMLPYFLHNVNNLMVGVLGNIDLAGMFVPEMERVEPKIAGARVATVSVVEYLRGIAGSIPSDDCVSFDGDVIGKCLTLLKAACGRSVNATGLAEIDISLSFNCVNPSKAVAALLGMAAWVVVSLGGNGTITGYSSDKRLGLKWFRLEGTTVPYMPGNESGSSILAAAGGLAASAGLSLLVENWTENEGEVSLVFRK